MKLLREIIGYVLGGVLFVALMPTVMWLASGMPKLEHIGAPSPSPLLGTRFSKEQNK